MAGHRNDVYSETQRGVGESSHREADILRQSMRDKHDYEDIPPVRREARSDDRRPPQVDRYRQMVDNEPRRIEERGQHKKRRDELVRGHRDHTIVDSAKRGYDNRSDKVPFRYERYPEDVDGEQASRQYYEARDKWRDEQRQPAQTDRWADQEYQQRYEQYQGFDNQSQGFDNQSQGYYNY